MNYIQNKKTHSTEKLKIYLKAFDEYIDQLKNPEYKVRKHEINNLLDHRRLIDVQYSRSDCEQRALTAQSLEDFNLTPIVAKLKLLYTYYYIDRLDWLSYIKETFRDIFIYEFMNKCLLKSLSDNLYMILSKM